MPPLYNPSNCLICKKQLEIMVSLDQSLNECDSFTVAQVLQNLHFLTIPDLERLGRVLCFICVAKVQSCFDFKTQCFQIGKELETENAFIETFGDASLLPEDDMTPITIEDNPLEENSTANNDIDEIIDIAKVKEEINVELIEITITNMESVIPETSATISGETKIEIAENILKVENDESVNRAISVDSKKQKGKRKPPYVCDVCKEAFFFINSLIKHKQIHTGEGMSACDVCNKKFECSEQLMVHKRVHTGEKPFVCDVCCKSFANDSHLNRHKRIHTGEWPYACDICKKAFLYPLAFKSHKRFHTGEKPYACDFCNKKFSKHIEFSKHKRVHMGEKHYPCDVCDKILSSIGHLKRHKRSHTHGKSYKCLVCKKSFMNLRFFLKHKRFHKKKSCVVCKKSFKNLHTLLRHEQSHASRKP